MKMIKIAFVFAILVLAGWYFWPSAVETVLTREEINAGAVEAAISDYRREYDWSTKTWTPDVRSREDAIQSVLVDMGSHPDIIAERDAYARRFSLPTVYTKYVEEGTKIALAKRLHGERMVMPELKIAKGYHITRSNGSAAIVKDGDPEPIFGCMEGYQPTGNGCIRAAQ
jgi:hypothetical protein